MELQIVTFEQAKCLRELGFPQDTSIQDVYGDGELRKCFYPEDCTWYRDIVTAPSLELAAKWLREEKLLYLSVQVNEHCTHWFWDIIKIRNEEEITDPSIKGYWSYEEALSAGIDKAIEILK